MHEPGSDGPRLPRAIFLLQRPGNGGTIAPACTPTRSTAPDPDRAGPAGESRARGLLPSGSAFRASAYGEGDTGRYVLGKSFDHVHYRGRTTRGDLTPVNSRVLFERYIKGG